MSGFVLPPDPPSLCRIRGADDVVAHVSAEESGATSIARVAGFAEWEMIALSGDSESGRARVRWSTGTPGMHLEGWVDAVQISFRAKHDLPLVAGHAWINVGAALRVRPEGTSAQVSPLETAFADIRSTVKCEDLRIGPGELEPILNAPSYWTSAQKTLALHAGPKGTLVTTLAYAGPFGGQPYAALEVKDGFVHLVHYEGIHFDGWVKETELVPWLSEPPQGAFVCGMGSLEFDDSKAKVRTVSTAADVFLDASDAAPKIGSLDPGARVRVGASHKSFVEVSGEHGQWQGPLGKKLWVRGSSLSP